MKWVYCVLTLLLGVLIGVVLHILLDAINGIVGWNVFLYYLGWTLFCLIDCIFIWIEVKLIKRKDN